MSGTVETALRTHFAANISTEGRSIREPNTDFDPQGLPWFELRFPGARTDRGDIGEASNPMWDEAGAFMVDVYVPAGSGSALAAAMADEAWAIFAGQEIEGIRCDTRMQGQSGPREVDGVEGIWWGLSFGIGYRYLHFLNP